MDVKSVRDIETNGPKPLTPMKKISCVARERCYRYTETYGAMQPILISLKLAGLHCVSVFRVKPALKDIILQSYCILMILFLTGNLIRCCILFEFKDGLGSEFLFELSFLAWQVQICICSWSMLWACCSHRALPEFFLSLDEIPSQKNVNRYGFISQRTLAVTVLAWCFIGLNMVFFVYGLIAGWIPAILIYPAFIAGIHVYTMKVYATFVLLCFTTAWLLPVTLAFHICRILSHEFKCHRFRLQEAIKSGLTTQSLRQFRLDHEQLCDLVESADVLLSVTLAANFLGALAEICAEFYILTTDGAETEAGFTVAVSFWCGVVIVILVGLLLSAADVNKQVSCCSHWSLLTMTIIWKKNIEIIYLRLMTSAFDLCLGNGSLFYDIT